MKKLSLIALAALVGTFAAIRLDDWWDPRQSESLISAALVPQSDGLLPVQRGTLPAVPDFRAAAQRITPAVVSIDTLARSRWFGDEVQPVGSGSGVVISRNGYIITNNHVVRIGMGQRLADIVRVHFANGKSLEARVVGADPRSDLAVLKVEADNLTAASLGSSDRLQVGEWVIAAGNPLGYENTISVGVVSSLGRTLPTEGAVLIDAIQTDAAINQGNSGGALTNTQGELVGINTAIASTSGGSIGIGFAIPIDRAKRVVDDLVKLGRVPYGVLGLNIDQRSGLLGIARAREELKHMVGAEPPAEGLLVSRVQSGAPAADAGMRDFSVLLSIDGRKMDEPGAFVRALVDKRAGDAVKVEFWQAGRKETRTIRLADLGRN